MKSGGKRVRWWSTVFVAVTPAAMTVGVTEGGRRERETSEGERAPIALPVKRVLTH